MAGLILVSSMCGYVLNRREKFKITKVIFLLILSGIMFPYQMSILGLYKVIRGLHLMNSLTGVILVLKSHEEGNAIGATAASVELLNVVTTR